MENIDNHSYDVQKNLWKVEQEILDVIHNVCEKNNLRYSLAYGTLLGAVRHHGFIPWDDDVDIMMPRDDYEKLKNIWKECAPENYILEDYHICHEYSNNFAKVRKDNTTFLQLESERNKSYHKGIFVDIFPFDRVAPGNLSRKIQFALCAINLLYNRGYTSCKTGFRHAFESLLLKIPKSMYYNIQVLTERKIRAWNDKKEKLFCPCTIKQCKVYYPNDLFDEITFMEFNGKKYKTVKKWNDVLKVVYGDYMALPPEEERVWKHHPIEVDFEHNYED
jgi:lipopolysaccharide cholinephosphotransferase